MTVHQVVRMKEYQVHDVAAIIDAKTWEIF
jgi:hypothetical protein